MKAPPSSLHAKVLPASVLVKSNDADVWLVGLVGAPVMLVSGAAVSTVQLWLAGEASVLPAASVARHLEGVAAVGAGRCSSSGSSSRRRPPPSSLHSKVAAGLGAVEGEGRAALLATVSVGAASRSSVSGAVVSTVQV